MATKKKLLQAAAGTAAASGGAGGLNIEDVFSTYLYEGTGATQSITNDIDLSGEGGLVWIKVRNTSTLAWHSLSDTERGAGNILRSDLQNAQFYDAAEFASFNSDGFTIAGDAQTGGSGNDYASWTFRKAPKFFDVVTYTGNGTAGRTISHNLGSVPGMIIVKCTNQAENWLVYHRGSNSNPEDYYLELNGTGAASSGSYWNNTLPTSTEFTIGGNSGPINQTTGTYVAYLFAHNDGDGDFGPDGDADIIKCGSYTGNGSTAGPEIDLGFEPQWILLKGASAASSWILYDTMRGMTVGTTNAGPDANLYPHSSAAEYTDYHLSPTPTGFQIRDTGGNTNTNGNTYIYIAIRRGPMAVPESATDVFDINERLGGYPTPTLINTGNEVDLLIGKRAESSGGGETYFWDRLRGGIKYLQGDNTAAETGTTEYIEFDTNEGFREGFFNASHNQVHWTWKRAPNYFDVVAYNGVTGPQTVSHNLGVAPEMMWVKRRNAAWDWYVYHKDLDATNPSHKYLELNDTAAVADWDGAWNDTDPTSSVFSVGDGSNPTNTSGGTYIAYLFASLDGVSKVGSFTAGSTDTFVDCGFSSSARFVLMKRSSGIGDWFVYDSERGYVAGTGDKRLKLNTTDAETTNNNIDPTAGGFTVTGNTIDAGTYIFYAIA